MYKRVPTDDIAYLENDEAINPVSTLADEFGGRCQIAIDDHCYVLFLKQSNEKYKPTSWIFPEAFQEIKMLPNPVPTAGISVSSTKNNDYLVYYELHIDNKTFYLNGIISAPTEAEAMALFFDNTKYPCLYGEHYSLQKKGFIGLLSDSKSFSMKLVVVSGYERK